MAERRVAVCGVPSSGNRLVRGMLQRHGCWAEVVHYADVGSGKWQRLFSGAGRVSVILPLRDARLNEESLRAKAELRGTRPGVLNHTYRTFAEIDLAHWRPTLELVAGFPCFPVRFGDIIEEPEEWGRRIAEFVGVEWQGWGVEVVDADARHREALDADGMAEAEASLLSADTDGDYPR